MDYNKEIKEILKIKNINVKIIYVTKSFTNWDKDNLHNQYKVVLIRDTKTMQFDFWDSIRNTEEEKKPTVYDVLSCLEWYELGDFDDFCYNYGYDNDSITAFKLYAECQKQQKDLFALIPEEETREKIIALL